MKKIAFLNPPPLYVEIGQTSLKALRENDGVEVPLERLPDGRLTAPCREKVAVALKKFLQAKGWQPRTRALCAISARGVSLRQLTLPIGAKEEFHQRLLLQIESEFPLPPDELAWGWQHWRDKTAEWRDCETGIARGRREKRSGVGLSGTSWSLRNESSFHPAALARSRLWPQPPKPARCWTSKQPSRN